MVRRLPRLPGGPARTTAPASRSSASASTAPTPNGSSPALATAGRSRRSLEAGIPADRVFQLGALVEPTGVAYIAIFVSAGGFMPGASVGVVGAGPIGLAAIALARAAGAGRIVAFEVAEGRRELATAMGADHRAGPAGARSGRGHRGRARGFPRSRDRPVGRGAAAPRASPRLMAATLAPAGRMVLIGRGPHTIDLDPECLIVRGAADPRFDRPFGLGQRSVA